MTRKDDRTDENTKGKYGAKKSEVLGSRKRRPHTLMTAILVTVVLVGGGLYFWHSEKNLPPPQYTSLKQAPQASTKANVVTFPVSLFNDGQARHFEHRTPDVTIRYFVLKSADGMIRAAFDACDVCWPAGEGYYQNGDYMVCRNCGQRFASVGVNEIQGGCNPAPLHRKVVNDEVVIRIADILTGSRYFNFSQKPTAGS